MRESVRLRPAERAGFFIEKGLSAGAILLRDKTGSYIVLWSSSENSNNNAWNQNFNNGNINNNNKNNNNNYVRPVLAFFVKNIIMALLTGYTLFSLLSYSGVFFFRHTRARPEYPGQRISKLITWITRSSRVMTE